MLFWMLLALRGVRSGTRGAETTRPFVGVWPGVTLAARASAARLCCSAKALHSAALTIFRGLGGDDN
jgi:hypothetical protein